MHICTHIATFCFNRGLCVPVIYKATIENPTTEDVELANILGMVYQIVSVWEFKD